MSAGRGRLGGGGGGFRPGVRSRLHGRLHGCLRGGVVGRVVHRVRDLAAILAAGVQERVEDDPGQNDDQGPVHGRVAGGEGDPQREQRADPADQQVPGQQPPLHPSAPRYQVGQLGARREQVRDGHGDHGEVDQVGEDREPGARGVAPEHEQRGQHGCDHDAEPGGAVAVVPGERLGEQAIVRGCPRALGGDQRPAVQRPYAGYHGRARDHLPGPRPVKLSAATAVISGIGALNGWTLVTTECSRAPADDGLFPKAFAWNDRNGTAWFGIVIAALLPSLLMLWRYTSSSGLTVFTYLVDLTVVTVAVPYLFSACAQLTYLVSRRRRVQGWLLARDLLICGASALFSLWVTFASGYQAVYQALVVVLAGVILYAFLNARREDSGQIPDPVDNPPDHAQTEGDKS